MRKINKNLHYLIFNTEVVKCAFFTNRVFSISLFFMALHALLPLNVFAEGFGNYEFRTNSHIVLRAAAVKDSSETSFISVGRMWTGAQYKGLISSFNNADGALNQNFLPNTGSTDGRKLIDFAGGGYDNLCNAVTYAHDGYVAACRSMKANGYYDIYLAKFNSSGTMNTNFGTNGIVTTGIGGDGTNGQAFVRGITYNASGNSGTNNGIVTIVGAVGSTLRPFIASFNQHTGAQYGSTVKETGINGTAVGVVNDGTYYYMVSTDKDVNHDIYIHRYNDGLTSSWGSALDLSASGATTEAIPASVAIIGSNLVIAGSNKESTGTPSWKCMVLSVVKATGALNTSFGVVSGGTDNQGVTLFQPAADKDCILNAVAPPPSGSDILVTGTTYNGTNYDHIVGKMNSSGVLDTGFDSDGYKIQTAGPADDVSNFALYLDGSASNIYAGGRVQDSNTYNGLALNKMSTSSGAFTLETTKWTTMTTTGAPSIRYSPSVVWTGSKMVVWGGANGGYVNTGGQFDPVANSWTITTTSGAPAIRNYESAVWTGSRVIIWGGGQGAYKNTGGQYDPANNTWTTLSTTGAPVGRYAHNGHWTGSKMIVWGGYNGSFLNTGGQYDPSNNTWTVITTSDAPQCRFAFGSVWTGSKMILWGGLGIGGVKLNTGGQYDPSNDTWTSTSSTNVPSARQDHESVWTGTKMIVWGGVNDVPENTGGQYDPANNTWTATSTTGAPKARSGSISVWTGTKMLIWGGYNASPLNTGAQYDPNANSWAATTISGAPSVRYETSKLGVWTGAKLIVWGGDYYGAKNTGAVYYPGALNSSASPKPSVTYFTASQTAVSSHGTITIKFYVAEAVSTSLTSANISLTTLSGNPSCTKTLTSNNASEIVFNLTGCTGDGTLNASLASAVATDEFGNISDASDNTETLIISSTDTDSDGFPDDYDNCPSVAGADQTDLDEDSYGVPCDSDDEDDSTH